jgi:hypothetical protein
MEEWSLWQATAGAVHWWRIESLVRSQIQIDPNWLESLWVVDTIRIQHETHHETHPNFIQISSNITWIITWIITIQVVPVRTTFVTCLPGALVLPGSGSGDARVHQWVWGSPSYWRFWPGFLWVFYDFLMFCLGCLGVLQYWIKWIKVDFCLFRLCAAFSGAALWKFMETVTHVQRMFNASSLFSSLFLSLYAMAIHGSPHRMARMLHACRLRHAWHFASL